MNPDTAQKLYARQLFQKHGDLFPEYQWFLPHERMALHRWRKRGHKKFDPVSFGDWTGPLKLTTTHRKICILAAGGILHRYIGRKLGYSESRLSIILSSSLARLYVAELREQFTHQILLRRAMNWGFTMHDVWGRWGG